MKKILILTLIIICSLFSQSEAANKFYWANGLSGGGDAIDGIDGAIITAGDGCFVVLDSGTNTPKFYLYRAQASSAAEDSPNVITPDSNAGTMRWHLAGNIVASITSQGATNDNYIKIINNSSRAATASVYELYPETAWKVNTNGTESYMGHFVTAPTTGTDACTQGQFSGDANYVYVCYGTNTWVRAVHTDW
jgi:hypothetical protein